MNTLLPGDRLALLRIESGFASVREFHRACERAGYPVEYRRLLKLEKTLVTPDHYELDAICLTLKITSDCWLRGVCNERNGLTSELTEALNKLGKAHRDLVIEIAKANIRVIKDKFSS